MRPWVTVDRSRAPDGAELVLARREGEWVIRCAGRVLMSSRQHGSEEALAALALERAAGRRAVLVGGLGLGFTVRAALDRMLPGGRVVVAELAPAVVEWNRAHLGALAAHPLDDPRTRVHVGDVADRIADSRGAYDAILLDVDNGPGSVLQASNHRLYGARGVARCREALRPGGCLAVWSAQPDRGYLERLERAGLDAEARVVPARGAAGGLRHVIFLAVKRDARRYPASPSRQRRSSST